MKELRSKCADAAMVYDVLDEAVQTVYLWVVDGISINGKQSQVDIVDGLIYAGVRSMVEDVRREARNVEPYSHKPGIAAKSQEASLSVVNAVCMHRFFTRHKVNNKSLGDCCRSDIEWARDHHSRVSVGNDRRSKFYDWLSGKIVGKRSVKNSVKESIVEEAYGRFLRGEKIAFV